MSRACLTATWLSLFAACGGAPDAPVDAGADGPAPDPFVGGAVVAPGCGDTVRLGLGATPPVVASERVGPDATPWQVHLGVTGDPRTSIAVTWRTIDETTERTALLVDGVRRTGVTWQYRDIDDRVIRMHEVHVCELAPDRAYAYLIEGDPGGQTGTFRTAPDLTADPGAEVVALVFGDARSGADVLAQLLARADVAETPDLLLFTGDAVLNGARQREWDEFYAAGAALFKRVPMVSAIGNHETGDIVTFSEWALPGDEQWFSLDYGAAHVVVLDDSPWLSPDVEGIGAAFLRADLPAAPPAAWRIVVHHQAMYSAALGHPDGVILRNRWGAILDEHAVDLVLAGHDHNYERTHPLRDGIVRAPGQGTTYVVTAGAGAPLVAAGEEHWTARSASVHHTMTLRIRASTIVAQAVDVSGMVVDEFSLTR